ncbi:MAG TPA: hypothetical protein VFA07_19160 [Chthonomonadaceae bacterium]|nr:hypothetical protein [Chthonomonadaceae bacterium]
MGNTQERIKKRRQYLTKKGAAYTKLGFATLLAVPFAVLSFLALLAALYVFALSFDARAELAAGGILLSLIVGFVSVCLGVAAFYCAYAARRAHREARQLPYAPPVSTGALPNAEVLLRGSEEPAQEQSKVLLRGANSTGAAEQELLRSSRQLPGS